MRICKWALRVGAVLGWAGAVALGVLDGVLDDRTVPVMMVLLSLALFCSASLRLNCYQRPLGAAYDLGYKNGRQDAMREMNLVSGRSSRNARVGRLIPLEREPIRARRERDPSMN